ncbi:MAG: hypothetical protein WBA23_09610 [Tunicatimonas sp.]|uniref:hypothetical protein n=1 Tax=Tunicatimonas sp. TaxID=1940096 RepID=UPI003C758A10
MKFWLLILFLTFFQVAVAQPPLKATIILDSLIQQFIDQYSVTLTPDDLAGSYTLTKDFWQESIHLKDDGRFNITSSRGFSNVSMSRGTWQVTEDEVLLNSRTGQEVVYPVKYGGKNCLLATSSIEKWKTIAKNLPPTSGKLVYNPFMGQIDLYTSETEYRDQKK